MPNVGDTVMLVIVGFRFAWGAGVGVVGVPDPPLPPPHAAERAIITTIITRFITSPSLGE